MSLTSPPRLQAVNVALPVDAGGLGSAQETAINKQPVTGSVAVRALGLAGDDVGDKRHHGGLDKAVYAFAREDLDLWSQRLGSRLPSGSLFGENLTTVGIDVNAALVGERWRIGTALLEVSHVRIPCNGFANWLGIAGHDPSGWLRRFTAEARPGAYLRVLEEGALQVGDAVEVLSRPAHGVTVSMMFRALTTERELLPELLQVTALPAKVRAKVEAYVGERDADATGTAALLEPA